MNGLNKIFKNFEIIREQFLKSFPKENDNINNIFNSLLQIFENLIYENKRGSQRRYKGMEPDVPVESMFVLMNQILANINNSDEARMRDNISLLGAQLEHIKWDVDSALKSINKLQNKWDKNKG